MVSPSGERAKVWRASTISSQFLQPPGAKWASWASGTRSPRANWMIWRWGYGQWIDNENIWNIWFSKLKAIAHLWLYIIYTYTIFFFSRLDRSGFCLTAFRCLVGLWQTSLNCYELPKSDKLFCSLSDKLHFPSFSQISIEHWGSSRQHPMWSLSILISTRWRTSGPEQVQERPSGIFTSWDGKDMQSAEKRLEKMRNAGLWLYKLIA